MPSRYVSSFSTLNTYSLSYNHQARIAEEAGACAVMALERVPADIRREGKHLSFSTVYFFAEYSSTGGVARMVWFQTPIHWRQYFI